jgi:hypothetical protein
VLLEPGYNLDSEKRLLMSGAIGVALLAIAVLDLATTESARDLTRNWIAFIRIGGSGLIMVIGLAKYGMSAGLLMLLAATICAVQVAADIYRNVTVSVVEDMHSS